MFFPFPFATSLRFQPFVLLGCCYTRINFIWDTHLKRLHGAFWLVKKKQILPSIHQSKAHKSQNNNQTLLFSNAFNSEEYSSHAQYGLSHHARKYVFFKCAPFRYIEFPFRKSLRFLQPKAPNSQRNPRLVSEKNNHRYGDPGCKQSNYKN